jgi:mono/diheme cytochrome c family protein
MNMRIVIAATCAVLTLATATLAQDNAASGIENPFRGVMQDRTYSSDDEALYVENCSMCHRQMGMGTVLLSRRLPGPEAQLEHNRRVTVPYITAVARQGMGNMPRISRAEVSDEEMERIANYIVAAVDQ